MNSTETSGLSGHYAKIINIYTSGVPALMYTCDSRSECGEVGGSRAECGKAGVSKIKHWEVGGSRAKCWEAGGSSA